MKLTRKFYEKSYPLTALTTMPKPIKNIIYED